MAESSHSHPYAGYQGTAEWLSIDRALGELARNQDLVETTSHEYIVGYLCQALAHFERQPTSPEESQRRLALARLRQTLRNANIHDRDLVAELIAERKHESEHE